MVTPIDNWHMACSVHDTHVGHSWLKNQGKLNAS